MARTIVPSRSMHAVAVVLLVLDGSLVDLAAFAQGLVGTASAPSAVVRILLGVLCFVAVGRVTGEGRVAESRRADGPAGYLPPEGPEINRTPPAS
jgi:hypothetical protein